MPSAAFGRLAGVVPARMVVAANGTDSTAVRPVPPPDAPNWYFVHRGCVSVANLH